MNPRPPTKPKIATNSTTHILYCRKFGNLSSIAVVTVSISANYRYIIILMEHHREKFYDILTCESKPSVSSMTKNSNDHSGDIGKRVTTSG